MPAFSAAKYLDSEKNLFVGGGFPLNQAGKGAVPSDTPALSDSFANGSLGAFGYAVFVEKAL